MALQLEKFFYLLISSETIDDRQSGRHELYEYNSFLSNKFYLWMFSNFSRHGFLLDGIYWPTAEQYFQSEKFLETNLKVEIANLASLRSSHIWKEQGKTSTPRLGIHKNRNHAMCDI
jgi:predicted NAD-dependent protein-ADP-ribosyltransferase YbiA (DUF1768 family)